MSEDGGDLAVAASLALLALLAVLAWWDWGFPTLAW
jgi:hypothetical protein